MKVIYPFKINSKIFQKVLIYYSKLVYNTRMLNKLKENKLKNQITEREELLQAVSDAHKYALGFRPNINFYTDYSNKELESEARRYCDIANEETECEENYKAGLGYISNNTLNKTLNTYIQYGAKNLYIARNWLIAANKEVA